MILNAAFQMILNTTRDMIFVKDMDLVYAAASKPFAEMVGKPSAEEIVGRTDFEIFHDDALASRYTSDDRKLLSGGKNLVNYIEPLTDDNGKPRYASTSKYILTDDEGNAIGILGVSIDVTREYIAQQHHQQELRFLFNIPEHTYAAVFVDVDDWRIIGERRQTVDGCFIPACNTIDEYAAAAEDSVVDSESVRGFYRSFSRERFQTLYAEGQMALSMEYQRRMKEGHLRWVRHEAKFLTDPANGHLCIMLVLHDINTGKLAQAKLIKAAELDEMTGLLNRSATTNRIEKYLTGKGANGIHALLMIDIDNFKQLNDTHGHQAGDRFLIAAAECIKSSFRDGDIVGRIGGDEFFVLMKNIPDRQAVEIRGNAMLKAIRRICDAYPALPLSASVGISLYREDGLTLTELYARADEALYAAKSAGKNRLTFV